METDDIRRAVADGMPQTITDLERLVRIPSIGSPGYDPSFVRESAEATAEILRSAGVGDARLLELDGGHPAVFGAVDGPAGAPTVLLYAHHDVQPARSGRPLADARRSTRSCATAVCTAAARPTTRAASWSTRRPSGRSARRRHRAARDRPDRRRGRGGMLHRTSAAARAGPRRPAAGRRRGDRRRRQLPHRRSHDRHERPRGRRTVASRSTCCRSPSTAAPSAARCPTRSWRSARMIATLHDDRGDVTLEGLHRFEWAGTPPSPRRSSCARNPARLRLRGADRLGHDRRPDASRSPPSTCWASTPPRVAELVEPDRADGSARVIGLRLAPGDDPSAPATP